MTNADFRTTLVLVVLAFASAAVGADGRGRREGRRVYDPATVETVTGTVRKVERVVARRGSSDVVELVLDTDRGELRIHVGPAAYLAEQNVTMEPGDRLSVRGSRVTRGGVPVVIAAEITKGDTHLVLRDAAGVPRWRSGRR